jgi:hypothetical protein
MGQVLTELTKTVQKNVNIPVNYTKEFANKVLEKNCLDPFVVLINHLFFFMTANSKHFVQRGGLLYRVFIEISPQSRR